jgi:carbon starvation protein
MLQDFLGTFFPKLHKTESWISNILATVICVGAWGYFLYQGIVDPLGGINTLWPLFGIANQMLAAIALIFISVILVKMRNVRYIWVTLVPTIGLLICTLTAAWQKIFSPNPKIGFLAHATIYDAAVREGNILAPAHDLREMVVIIFNDRIDAALAIFFSVLIIYMLLRAIFVVWRQNRAGNSLSPIQ